MYGVYMLTFGVYIDGKCYHIWHTWIRHGIYVLIHSFVELSKIGHDERYLQFGEAAVRESGGSGWK